jgi:hypothetical protein
MFFLQLAILREGAACLTHQPNGRVVDRLASAGGKKTLSIGHWQLHGFPTLQRVLKR